MTPASKRIAIGQIRTLMEFWQITVEDVQEAGDAPARKPEPVVPVKYRHPTTAETWDGQGSQPEWLRKALLDEGYLVDELRI